MDRSKLMFMVNAPTRMGGVQRRYRRGRVTGFQGDIADGHRVVGGMIDDVSATGFKLVQVDETFMAEKHTYQAVVSGNGKYYKVLAKPCWKQATDKGVEIGFKVVDTSWEWLEFVLDTIPGGDHKIPLTANA